MVNFKKMYNKMYNLRDDIQMKSSRNIKNIVLLPSRRISYLNNSTIFDKSNNGGGLSLIHNRSLSFKPIGVASKKAQKARKIKSWIENKTRFRDMALINVSHDDWLIFKQKNIIGKSHYKAYVPGSVLAFVMGVGDNARLLLQKLVFDAFRGSISHIDGGLNRLDLFSRSLSVTDRNKELYGFKQVDLYDALVIELRWLQRSVGVTGVVKSKYLIRNENYPLLVPNRDIKHRDKKDVKFELVRHIKPRDALVKYTDSVNHLTFEDFSKDTKYWKSYQSSETMESNEVLQLVESYIWVKGIKLLDSNMIYGQYFDGRGRFYYEGPANFTNNKNVRDFIIHNSFCVKNTEFDMTSSMQSCIYGYCGHTLMAVLLYYGYVDLHQQAATYLNDNLSPTHEWRGAINRSVIKAWINELMYGSNVHRGFKLHLFRSWYQNLIVDDNGDRIPLSEVGLKELQSKLRDMLHSLNPFRAFVMDILEESTNGFTNELVVNYNDSKMTMAYRKEDVIQKKYRGLGGSRKTISISESSHIMDTKAMARAALANLTHSWDAHLVRIVWSKWDGLTVHDAFFGKNTSMVPKILEDHAMSQDIIWDNPFRIILSKIPASKIQYYMDKSNLDLYHRECIHSILGERFVDHTWLWHLSKHYYKWDRSEGYACGFHIKNDDHALSNNIETIFDIKDNVNINKPRAFSRISGIDRNLFLLNALIRRNVPLNIANNQIPLLFLILNDGIKILGISVLTPHTGNQICSLIKKNIGSFKLKSFYHPIHITDTVVDIRSAFTFKTMELYWDSVNKDVPYGMIMYEITTNYKIITDVNSSIVNAFTDARDHYEKHK